MKFSFEFELVGCAWNIESKLMQNLSRYTPAVTSNYICMILAMQNFWSVIEDIIHMNIFSSQSRCHNNEKLFYSTSNECHFGVTFIVYLGIILVGFSTPRVFFLLFFFFFFFSFLLKKFQITCEKRNRIKN